MTDHQRRLLELIERLDAALRDLRAAVEQGPDPQPDTEAAVEAFADEAFRARDA
jgi:hypothetical protein